MVSKFPSKNMNMFAKFDENPAMTRDIKETKRYRRTHRHTEGRTMEKQYTHHKVCGGIVVVVVFVFNVPPTAKVIWRRSHGLKSHPTDW